VDLVAQVPIVAQVEAPGMLELFPGETRVVTLRVACNQPWLLSVHSENPQIKSIGRHVGCPGGMAAAGNSVTVVLTCSPEADGPQRTTLSTRLVSGPLVAALPRG
jgi:hypothetical protein